MLRYILLITISILLTHCTTTAQTPKTGYTTKKTVKGKALKYYEKGMDYNLKGANQKAIAEFEKALKAKPDFIDAQIQWAAVNYYIENFPAAEVGFEKVLKIDPHYQKKVIYVLGLTELQLKKYGEAIQHLEQYVASKPKNKALLTKAEKKLAEISFTATAIEKPVPFNPKSLGNKVNTPNAEYLPSFTADGQTLVYTMRVRGQEDFYMSRKVEDVWQEGVALDDVNTPLNEGAQSISADGKLLVFTACDRRKDGYGSCDIYFSEFKNNRWTKPANIGAPVNQRSWDSQPSLSADGKALFFSSKRNGGKGGIDIWVSYRDEDGKWGTPQSLSEVINTSGDEQSPFIHADGQTLYFMSNGHPGMGGFDLFYSRKQKDGKWGKPVNLGFPINTKADESTLVISLDGRTAYFASDRKLSQDGEVTRKEEKINGMDLYSFELYPEARPQPVTYVKAKVVDAVTQKSIVAKVEFVDLTTGQMHAFSNTEKDGEFLVCLPLGKNYALNVSKSKYLFHSEHFDLAGENSLDKPYALNIALQPLPEEAVPSAEVPSTAPPAYKPIVLRNVFFDTGSADLKPESFMELNRLKSLLDENPNMHIQVNGHTDNVGTDADNLTLSDNRAKAVQAFLIENGIDAGRLKAQGFGETQPIDTNDTPAGRQNNRRTEFVVISK